MKIDLEQLKADLMERREMSAENPHASQNGWIAPRYEEGKVWYHQGIIDGVDYALFALHMAEVDAKKKGLRGWIRRHATCSWLSRLLSR